MNDGQMNEGGSLEELHAQVVLQREAIAQLEDERRRLEQFVLELPKLFSVTEPAALVATIAEAARRLADATFALFVPAEIDLEPTLAGLEWSDFADRPTPGLAPLFTLEPGATRARTVADVARWAPGDVTARLYGVLSDGRLIRSWIIVPVRGHGQTLRGVLYLGHHRANAFSVHHETQVTVVGSRLGLALDAAVLAAEREEVIAALESSLLPPLLPSVPGCDIAARYRAAEGAANVGGDFYDVFRGGDGGWAVVLGDVCGAGPEAAAITGIARYIIRALALEAGPAETLERLNQTLLDHGLDGRFLTAVLANLRPAPDAIELNLANAGHPAPVLLADDGTAMLLNSAHGALLGALPAVKAPEIPVRLEPGDALVLYTDGVIEARDGDHEEFGTDRLVELVATCAGRTATAIARRIELAVLNHATGTTDDIALLVVRHEPSRWEG
jgi:serine phosphatase RsbU (regulator of sigma subunit)